MTDLPPDAALRIARWCWPEGRWNPGASPSRCLIDGGPEFSTNEWACLHNAEAVLIERGLEDAYGRALAHELWPENPHCTFAVAIAQVRTAPLTVVIRAILSAIDSNSNPSP